MAYVRNWQPQVTKAVGDIIEPATNLFFYFKVSAITTGLTGDTEPDFASIAAAGVGVIVDAGVTWDSIAANVIDWTCGPQRITSIAQPLWSTTIGGTTTDGASSLPPVWTTRTPAVLDAKCPQTKVAIIMAQKVFAAMDDVVRYSATNNARDWSAEDDAGFIPAGMHAARSPDVKALGDYRGKLAIWTSADLQIWNADPDPLEITIFDKIDGIGTSWPRAIAPIANDLLFLTHQGVRSLSIAASSTNLQTDDVGAPVDDPIKAAMSSPFLDTFTPFAHYFPSLGQFWLIFASTVWVHTSGPIGQRGSWSRYLLAYDITDASVLNGRLFLRTSTDILVEVDPAAVSDIATGFTGQVEWPYLDFGAPGVTKQLKAIDVVAAGNVTPSIQVGYNENDNTQFTPLFALPIRDTVPGARIPFCVAAPTLAVRLTWPSGGSWDLRYIELEFDDLGGGP